MGLYKVNIKETLEREETIHADSKDHAIEKIKSLYQDESIILDYNDFKDVEFSSYEDLRRNKIYNIYNEAVQLGDIITVYTNDDIMGKYTISHTFDSLDLINAIKDILYYNEDLRTTYTLEKKED